MIETLNILIAAFVGFNAMIGFSIRSGDEISTGTALAVGLLLVTWKYGWYAVMFVTGLVCMLIARAAIQRRQRSLI